MAETQVGPAYKRLANELRSQIARGDLPVGAALPSASQLMKMHDVSTTVVRDALKILRDEGLVYGQAGKAVYVRATPEESAAERMSLDELTQGYQQLETRVAGLSAPTDVAALEELREEMAELRRSVAVLQAQLIELYGRVGQPYPRDKAPLKTEASSDQARRAVGG
ncbi:GntR family transcriptional regulator [Streptomyces sp. ISL-10]|uniref:GntR family transcriptional regulator n=1 Tax=Streptomyces sp. ISL-10 TaxID=2819172 RepID=UPI001BE7D4D5|nr:GntR family transcriptional regulator [Streptomyces sp. ISL-10]MBT2367138.1 GntR family transcriptional regulator [Streptomyces sp. ISL-10]